MKLMSKSAYKTLTLTLAIAATVVLLPDAAHAGAGMQAILCNAIGFVTGNIGKAIATIAILILGIGAFFGKVTWGLAVLVAIGIGGVFGAVSVVNAVAGNTGNCGTAAAA